MAAGTVTAALAAQALAGAFRSATAHQVARFPGRAAVFVPTRLSLEVHAAGVPDPARGWSPDACRIAAPPGWWRRLWNLIRRHRAQRNLLVITVDEAGTSLTLDGHPPDPPPAPPRGDEP